MDIANQIRADLKLNSSNLEESVAVQKMRDSISIAPMRTINHQTTKKRSFDVAFLMQPDEKFKAKQQRFEETRDLTNCRPTNISLRTNLVDTTIRRISTDSPVNEEIDIMTNGNSNSSFGSSTNQVSSDEPARNCRYQPVQSSAKNLRIYSENLLLQSSDRFLSDLDMHRSAFTKVPHARLDSPAPPLSPDQLSCPSTSPPAISITPPRQFTSFRSDYSFMGNGNGFMALNHPASGNPEAMNGGKMMKHQYMYRPNGHEGPQLRINPDMSGNGYLSAHSFPLIGTSPPASPQMSQFSSELTGIVRHPAAAAILSTLIPPTLASTFTLTAQNVCAKCNISFRMTSDLVYHMRSHHKTDLTGDLNRRKREEKLKCPVCNESFRERHHLTRHMTAHQDKESDEADVPKGGSTLAQLSRRHSHSHLGNSHHHSPHNKTH